MRDADPIDIVRDDAYTQALGVIEFLRIQAGGAYDPDEDSEFFRGYFQALETSAIMIRNALLCDKGLQPSEEVVAHLNAAYARLVSDKFDGISVHQC